MTGNPDHGAGSDTECEGHPAGPWRNQCENGPFPNTPLHRPRRLRKSDSIRRLTQETRLSVNQFVYPLFVAPGHDQVEPIDAMPGQYIRSVDRVAAEAQRVADLGIPAVLLFGQTESKDPKGTEASSSSGAVQRSVVLIKNAVPELTVITDVCVCAYADHGHCGIVVGGHVDNDLSVARIVDVAVSHANAGADIVAPSDMMDGRVGAVRTELDRLGYSDVGILAYAAKYASAFYGPFRDVAHSAPQFGDRRSYQLDPANTRAALREVELDIAEGADLVMVKPALMNLDIIARVRDRVSVPIAAYFVSGEYAAIKAASARGWLDERAAVLESLTAIVRAGADIVVTYFAPEASGWLRENEGRN